MLVVLILGALVSLLPLYQAHAPQGQENLLEGDMTFEVYPDGSVDVIVSGSYEQALEPWSTPPPFYNLAFELSNSPAGTDLTEFVSTLVFKLGPEFTNAIANLELDAMIHVEEKSTEASIVFRLPGSASIDGRMEFILDEETSEGTLDLELTVQIWYALYPKESIEQFVQAFPLLKAMVVTQVSESTDGNLTIQDLTLVNSEIGPVYATLTVTASVVGDFGKGIQSLLGEVSIPYVSVPEIEPGLDLEELTYLRVRSADIHVTFENEEQAFTVIFGGVLEGDLDGLCNDLKNRFLEESLLDSDLDVETAQLINDFLLPTEISVVNLNTTFEYSLEDESQAFEFAVEGLGLRPPDAEALLTFLQYASEEVSQPSFTLTLKGMSVDREYVEIIVPSATSEPLLKESQQVVWKFDEIENLNQVTFEVKEKPSSLLTPQVVIPVAGVAIALAAAGLILAKRK